MALLCVLHFSCALNSYHMQHQGSVWRKWGHASLKRTPLILVLLSALRLLSLLKGKPKNVVATSSSVSVTVWTKVFAHTQPDILRNWSCQEIDFLICKICGIVSATLKDNESIDDKVVPSFCYPFCVFCGSPASVVTDQLRFSSANLPLLGRLLIFIIPTVIVIAEQ